ncbi:hypothetical protein ACVXG7_21360 [Enterobacter hormaechei]
MVERSVYRHGSSETELDNIILDPFVARINSPRFRRRASRIGVAARFTPVPASAGTKLARAEPERGEI